MDRNETAARTGTCRAIVPFEARSRQGRDQACGQRPMATFVTQLIVASQPGLRTSRLDRTRVAAALYGARR